MVAQHCATRFLPLVIGAGSQSISGLVEWLSEASSCSSTFQTLLGSGRQIKVSFTGLANNRISITSSAYTTTFRSAICRSR